MSANLQAKREPRWRGWLRRALRPKSFWRKRLDDQLPAERRPWWLKLSVGFVRDIVAAFNMLVVGGVLIAMTFQAAVWVFTSPDFFEVGLAAPVGHLLAQVCITTGRCDLGGLMIGLALTVVLTFSAVFVVFTTFDQLDRENDEDDEEDPLLEPLRVLDERLVHLRADLVLAGVLPLSAEEKAEVEDASP